MTFCISIGPFGGVYWRRGYATRLCLGWVAFTWLPFDMDTYITVTRRTLLDLHECTLQQHREIEKLKGGKQ